MKKIVFVMALIALAVMPAMAQVSTEGRVFYTMPKMDKQTTEDGRVIIMLQADGRTFMVYDQFGAPFPRGTEAGRSQLPDGKWVVYIQYPNGTQVLVTPDMVQNPEVKTNGGSNAQIQEFDFVGWQPDRAEIPASAKPEIDDLIQAIQGSIIKIKVYVLGGVSDENIRHAECFRSESSPYYLPRNGTSEFERVKGGFNVDGDNTVCQALLADGREKTFRDYLVSHGISQDMIQLSRWGGIIDIDNAHYNNRGVRVLLIPLSVYEQLKKEPPPPAPVIDIYNIDTSSADPMAPPPPPDNSDDCWKWAVGGGFGGAGLGWGASNIYLEGGQGSGNAGDGGSVSICGDDPTACIVGGAVFGAGSAYLTCEYMKAKKAK